MRWEVRDFKGVERAEVDLAKGKRTVLTGVNSSGKSSLIQSILLAAQSLYDDGPLVLNGPLARLGDPGDLVREDSTENQVTIAFDMAFGSEWLGEHVHVKVKYHLAPAGDQTTLEAKRIEISGEIFGSQDLVFASTHPRHDDRNKALARDSENHYALHLKSLLGNDGRQLRTYLLLQGLKPQRIVQISDSEDVESRYRRVVTPVLNDMRDMSPDTYAKNHSVSESGALVREFLQLLRTRFSRAAESGDADDRLPSSNAGIFAFGEFWREISDERRASLIEQAAQERARSSTISVPVRRNPFLPASFRGGALEIQLEDRLGVSREVMEEVSKQLDQLARRVQYLGPLRDEPRVVWNQWNEIAKGLPVGTRGEFSAAVLARRNSSRIDCVMPERTLVSATTLGEAVDAWLGYLEIGDNVSPRSHGKLGVGLDLEVNGRVRDLTSVGVGVSQALPLVVGLLAAPRASIFIVEQPELHLHPAVQARLADFMLTARPDLSLILETHSDSFITRVRRRVAEDPKRANAIDIVFVEPNGSGSVARRLTINEFGDLSEWPKGFLSSAESDVRAIMKFNIARLREGQGRD